MYQYKGSVVRVVDGDTLVIEVDLGFNIKYEAPFRLLGVNCPEIRGPEKAEGELAKLFAVEKVLNQNVVIATYQDKKDKYGRYLAIVVYRDQVAGYERVYNVALVESGHAQPAEGYATKVLKFHMDSSHEGKKYV